jgi:formylglycine-generating enzyme
MRWSAHSRSTGLKSPLASSGRLRPGLGLETAAEKAGGGFEYGAGWERQPGWTVYRPFGEAPESPNEPAVHVTWGEASAYCRWAGGRPPTSTEWIVAAYTETRSNPPGGFVTGRTYDILVARTEDANTSASDPWRRHAPAGATVAGVNGLYDMGGNVWEWAADDPSSARRTMGGSWWYGPDQRRCDIMASKDGDFYAVYVGFRCVYDRTSGQ